MKKEALRKMARQERKLLSEAMIEEQSKAIAQAVFSQVNFSEMHVVHCFLPARSKKEINTHYLINRIREAFPEIKIVVPLSDLNTCQMDCGIWDGEPLTENLWGIPEPASPKKIDAKAIDLVIVPLLGFDEKGNRVGYGKGFYDRFLAHCKEDTLKIGISLFPPIALIEDAEATDIPLNRVFTPQKSFYFS